MQGPPGLLSLIVKSILGRPFRNFATILCFIFLTGSILLTYFLVNGAQFSIQSGMDRLGADIVVIPQDYLGESQAVLLTGKPTTFAFKESVLDEVSQVNGVERVTPQLYIGTLQNTQCCSTDLQLIAFDPNNDYTIIPWLEEELGRQLKKDECIIGSRIFGDVGKKLTFYGHDFTIAGRLDPSGMALDTSVFIRMEDAYKMAEESTTRAVMPLIINRGQISAVLVRLDSGADREKIADDIRHSVMGTYTITSTYLAKKVNSQLLATKQILYILTAAITVVSFPFIALISSLVANERKGEFSILRSLGATRKFIFFIVFAEALILSLIGGFIGVGVSLLVISLFQPLITVSLNVPFVWPPLLDIFAYSMMTVFFIIGVGGLASLVPAVQSSGYEPYDGMRKGEL